VKKLKKGTSEYVLKQLELVSRIADCLTRLGVGKDGYNLKNFEVLYSKANGLRGETINERQRRRIVGRILSGKVDYRFEHYVVLLEHYTFLMQQLWKNN